MTFSEKVTLLKNKIYQLYVYADEYTQNNNLTNTIKAKNKLVLDYLRGIYVDKLWYIVADGVNTGFVNYVNDKENPSIYLNNIKVPNLICGDYEITHLAATISAYEARVNLLNDLISLIGESITGKEIDDLSGWAGDLLQIGAKYCSHTLDQNNVDEDDLYSLIGCTDLGVTNKYFEENHIITDLNEEGYSIIDWEQDIDAISIEIELNKNKTIYDAVYDFFTTYYDDRYNNYVNDIMDYSNNLNIEEEMILKVKQYTNTTSVLSVFFVNYFTSIYGSYDKNKVGNILAEKFVEKVLYYKNR